MTVLIGLLRWTAIAIQFACCWGLLAYALASANAVVFEHFAGSLRRQRRAQAFASRNDWQKGPSVLGERRTKVGE